MLTKTMMNSTRRMMWCSGVDAWKLETCFSPKIDNNDLTFISRFEKVFFRLTKTYFMNIHQLRCKYSNWYALVYLSFSMFLNANIDIHIRKKRYIWIQFLISIIDLLLTGCYEIFNSVVLDLSRRLLLVHFILRRKPTASVSVGEKNINTARISMNS